jgi:hypothetical protein
MYLPLNREFDCHCLKIFLIIDFDTDNVTDEGNAVFSGKASWQLFQPAAR